jgi:hypothetical protein
LPSRPDLTTISSLAAAPHRHPIAPFSRATGGEAHFRPASE